MPKETEKERESLWHETKCGKCGKTIMTMPNYVYRAKAKNGRYVYYCCWTCYAHRNDKTARDREETRNKIINGE